MAKSSLHSGNQSAGCFRDVGRVPKAACIFCAETVGGGRLKRGYGGTTPCEPLKYSAQMAKSSLHVGHSGAGCFFFGAACAADFEKQPAIPREKRYNTPVLILGTRHAANGILPPKSPAERFELSGWFSFFIAAAKRCDDRVIRLLPRIGRCGR